MRVLLISPPDKNFVYGEKIGKKLAPSAPALGIAYIAAVLEQNNISVNLLDARGEFLGINEIITEVKEYLPEIVGITCTTPMFGISVEIAKAIKAFSSDILVVMGGPHIAPTPVETIEKYPDIDVTVFGEGEYSMLELAQGKNLEDIKGIAYRKNGQVVVNAPREPIENLDSIPFPSRHFYNLNNYHQPMHEVYGRPLTTMLTSRGCPFNCSFCSSKVTFGRRVRFRSAENVLAEIDFLIADYGLQVIKFADDTFTLNLTRLEKICKGLKERGLPWIANARANTMTKEVLFMLKDSYCKLLLVGVESGDAENLKWLKKNVTLEQMREAFKWTNKLKIDTIATFIFGTHLETKETAQKTIDFAKEIKPTYANFFVLSPYPGTEACEVMKQGGMMAINDWTEVKSPKYQDYIINHPRFTKQDFRAIQKRAYREFYYNWPYIWFTLKRLTSFRKIKMYFELAGLTSRFIKK